MINAENQRKLDLLRATYPEHYEYYDRSRMEERPVPVLPENPTRDDINRYNKEMVAYTERRPRRQYANIPDFRSIPREIMTDTVPMVERPEQRNNLIPKLVIGGLTILGAGLAYGLSKYQERARMGRNNRNMR